jgi:hypothetical protein
MRTPLGYVTAIVVVHYDQLIGLQLTALYYLCQVWLITC